MCVVDGSAYIYLYYNDITFILYLHSFRKPAFPVTSSSCRPGNNNISSSCVPNHLTAIDKNITLSFLGDNIITMSGGV